MPTTLRFNYQGEVRTVTPTSVSFHFDGKQWLMRAYDESKFHLVDFAARDVSFL